MIKIYGENNPYNNIAKMAANTVLNYFDIEEIKVDIEINFVTNDVIRELNKKFRYLDSATDVLSFANIAQRYPYDFGEYNDFINPEDGSLLLGEIFISLEKAKNQAEEYGSTIEREVVFLVVHGLLHLLGYDHIEVGDEKIMNEIQRDIMEGTNL